MKKRLLVLCFYCWGIACLSIARAAVSHEDFAGYPGVDRPELRAAHRVEFLDQQLTLSPRQKHDLAAIYTEENVAITNGAPAPSKATLLKLAFAANDRIRPLLTPAQRGKFNLIPIGSGGGLVGRSPWERLDRLDKLVKLSAAQKKDALNVYLVGTEGLMENQSPDNAAAANQIKAAMAADIRSILTSEQRKLWDEAPVKR